MYGAAKGVWGQKIWFWVKDGHGKGGWKFSGVNGIVECEWMCLESIVAATRMFI